MKLLILVFLYFASNVSKAESASILVVFPMPSYSHYILGFRAAKALADRGHQVTFISPYPQKKPIKNIREISVEHLIKHIEDFKKQLFSTEKNGILSNMLSVYDLGASACQQIYESENVKKLLESKEHFDLILLEYFMDDSLFGLAHHFKAPLVLLTSLPFSFAPHIFAQPAPSSYVPSIAGSFTKRMNFWERLQNFLLNNAIDIIRELYVLPKHRDIFKKYIKTGLQLDDILYNASLLLSNSHVSVNDAIPLVPSIVEVGGFHVDAPKALPADIQKFLDEAKEGVVLFSMGSNLKSADLKPEVQNALIKSFSKIKQNVLWKFEEPLDGLPKNVKIMQWLPQQDILAHPNVRAFITHGGLLSSIETIYHGVPVIGIPVFGDQKSNIAAAVSNGYALSVPLQEITEEKLSWALDEILNNPKYREEAKRRSRVMNDQPLKPIDSLVFWIEYVIRHDGAPHLRSQANELRWFQRYMIDIIIFLTLITIALFIVFYIIIRKLLGLLFRKNINVSVSKKNK